MKGVVRKPRADLFECIAVAVLSLPELSFHILTAQYVVVGGAHHIVTGLNCRPANAVKA